MPVVTCVTPPLATAPLSGGPRRLFEDVRDGIIRNSASFKSAKTGMKVGLVSPENTERMQQTDDAWNGRDWDAFDMLHDPECVVYWPGREADPTRGGQDHRAEAIAFCDAFPDNKVKNRPYDVLFGEGDFTCFVTRFTGTFTAPMKQPDGSVIEPTGKSFDVLYSTAAKWRDGRIIEEYLFWDNGTFLRQVGLA